MALEMREKVFLGLLGVCLLHFIVIPDVEAAVSEKMLNQMKLMHQKTCMGQSGTTKAMLIKFAENGGELDDPAFKKYVLCMCKRFNLIKNGVMNFKEVESQAKMMLPPVLRDATLEAAAQCKNRGGDTAEDLVYNYITCSYSVNKKCTHYLNQLPGSYAPYMKNYEAGYFTMLMKRIILLLSLISL